MGPSAAMEQAGGRLKRCLEKKQSPWRARAGRENGDQYLLNIEPTLGEK